MRALLRAMRADRFADISAVLALYRPGPMGANAHIDYADRKTGRKPVTADPPGARRAARRHPRRHLRPDRLPGAGAGHRAEAGRLLARQGRPAAQGDGQEEEGDPGQGVRAVRGRHAGQRLLRRRDQDDLGHPGPVLRLRVQQGAHGRLRHGLLLDRLPEGQLPGRVHGRAAHLGGRRQGQVGAVPERVPPDGHQGAAARRQRVRRRTFTPVGQRHPVRHGRGAQRRRRRRRVDRRGPHGQGRVHAASPTSCARCRSTSATSASSSR